MNLTKRSWLMWIVALAILAVATDVWACPGCKEAIEGNNGQGDVVSGYMYSILFMMAMPFTLLASFVTYMYFQVRKARAVAAVAPIQVIPGLE
ncbi:MAG: hypothetical protein JSS27_00105 [Planctomycetes bacterium]|nr:hypothetical protein [Planctomycetota bacterium]